MNMKLRAVGEEEMRYVGGMRRGGRREEWEDGEGGRALCEEGAPGEDIEFQEN